MSLDSLAVGRGMRQIRLVSDDDLRTGGELGGIRRQLAVDHAQVVERISGGHRIEVEHVQEQTCALGVAEKLVTEPFAFGRARDEPGQIGDHERVVLIGAHDAERGLERREGIVCDLRLGRRQP